MHTVYHQEFVDEKTGEILQSRSVRVGKSYERFGMFRTTDGVEWVLSLSGDELKLLMILYVNSDLDGFVVIGKRLRVELCLGLGISGRTFSRLLNGLVEKDVLRCRGRFDYSISPLTFYRGSSKDLKNKIEYYHSKK